MIEKRTMWMVDYDAWLSKHRAKLKEQMPKVREFLEGLQFKR